MHDKIAAHRIADNDRYNAEMAKSLIDKIFFLDKVDAGLFVDFGCANGEMLHFIETVFPGVKLIGFDINEDMIAEAKARFPESKTAFTSSWDEVTAAVQKHQASAQGLDRNVCLVLSSVCHELQSYLDEAEKARVFDQIWGRAGIAFKYVAFRDMMASRSASRPSDPIAVARVQQVFEARQPGLLSQWESRWGSISEGWSLLHFLLTYRYVNSWEREYRENYLPVNLEDFLASVPKNYMPSYFEHFTLPFLRRRVKEDFDIPLTDATHLKAVFERVD